MGKFNDALGSVADRLYLNEEFDQAAVDASKTKAAPGSLVITSRSPGSSLALATPTIKRLGNDRQFRREYEIQKHKIQEMTYADQRTRFAIQTVAEVVVGAQKTMDGMQDALSGQFYGVARDPEFKKAINVATVQLWNIGASAIIAIVETFPKRVSEEF
jgi:hypothetical protein